VFLLKYIKYKSMITFANTTKSHTISKTFEFH